MFTIIKNCFFIITVLTIATACTHTPSKTKPEQPASDFVTISAQELAELKASAAQWEKARKGIARLLKYEDEITYLVKHIDIINAKAIEQSQTRGYSNRPYYTGNQQSYNKPSKSIPVTPATTAKSQPEKRNFALQLASVDSMDNVKKALTEIKKQAEPLFRGSEMLTNVEVAEVKDKTYYRLKISSYEKLKNAKTDCEIMKRYKVDCIVSNYTQNPF